jgi:NarL family two-component system response regulator LiaR
MADLIRILVADDHLVVRQGLNALFVPRNGMEVVGEAVDGAEAVEKARTLQPDVILIDLNMPVKSGLEAIADIIQENPAARILVLTSYGEVANVSAAIKAGALGYLLKNSSAEELFHSIRGVAMGSLSLTPDVAQALKQKLRQPGDTLPPPIPDLTERELDVLRGIAQGLSNQEIAEGLHIEKTTVRSHISSILNKLGMTNRTQAALYAVEIGLGRPKEKS